MKPMGQGLRYLTIILIIFTSRGVFKPLQAQVINEFLALNQNSNHDPQGDYDDWLEIYNPESSPLFLGGMYLTDDLSSPEGWQIPDTTLEGYGYLLIWCDEDTLDGLMHANFRLDGSGEQIGLFASDEMTIIDSVTYAAQEVDISFGRYPDGGNLWLSLIPTPSTTNQMLAVKSIDTTTPEYNGLSPAFPNPFNHTTSLRFTLLHPGLVQMRVFNSTGRCIRKLADGWRPVGTYEISLESADMTSGIYLVSLNTGDWRWTQKIVLLK